MNHPSAVRLHSVTPGKQEKRHKGALFVCLGGVLNDRFGTSFSTFDPEQYYVSNLGRYVASGQRDTEGILRTTFAENALFAPGFVGFGAYDATTNLRSGNYAAAAINALGVGLEFYGVRGVGRLTSSVDNTSTVTSRISADEFVGPLIGRSGFRNTDELAAAYFQRYQRYVDQGYDSALRQEAAGLRTFSNAHRNREIGNFVDRFARDRLRLFTAREGLTDAAGNLVAVNRRLNNPVPGAANYRQPDLVAGSAILDASLAVKVRSAGQITDILNFRPAARGVTIVRPAGLAPSGNIVGSYSLIR